MNNEFNNQNMNQFQNSNMNNQYSNNYNNLNNNKSGNNGLIAILVIIIIALAGVCIYLVFDNKDTNLDSNNDNNIQENESNDNSIGDKVLDEYYLKTTDIVDEHILEYRYSAIANNEISYNDFRKNYVVKNVIDSLEPMGNTKDEYDVKEVKEKYLDIYNDLFSSSFSIYLSNEIYDAGYTYSYDKNSDKIITGVHGGTASFYQRVIIDSKEENNLYKVKFAEGYFEYDYDENGTNGKYVLVIDSETNNNITGITDSNQTVKDNKDKLPTYEVTFEKVTTGYKFKDIKKVN